MDSKSVDAGHLTRIHNSVLAGGERRLLTAIAQRLPPWIMPDHLTCIGVAGSALIAIGCIAAHVHTVWLSMAVFGLFLNWFGDSTDGSLARYRGIERPRYGFFVDQFSDVVAHFMMLIGLGLSPLMRLDVALLALLGSLATMFYGHLKLQFSRTWQVSHYGVGPTELRIAIGAGLVWTMMAPLPRLELGFGSFTVFDVVGFLVFLAAIACIAIMFVSDRAKLAMIDPPRMTPPPETIMTPLLKTSQGARD